VALYRGSLPQLGGGLFLTDGGLETTLIFHEGLDLPDFAAFHLLQDATGTQVLRDYFRRYAAIASDRAVGFILESPTWRSNADWGTGLGYSSEALGEANVKSIELLEEVRDEFQSDDSTMVISGCVGPRGDGYLPADIMTPLEAQAYHAQQIGWFAHTAADLATAITMTNTNEAIGIARAGAETGLPVVLSFTVETDGRLPTGMPLGQAIQEVDAATDGYAAYYMINCAHPDHFADQLPKDEPWCDRIQGVRANASRKSHAELDEAEELDDGNPTELAAQYRALKGKLRNLNVLGGCCGTDHRHIEAMADSYAVLI